MSKINFDNAGAKAEIVAEMLGETKMVQSLGIKRVEKLITTVRESAHQYQTAKHTVSLIRIPFVLMFIGGLAAMLFPSNLSEGIDFLVTGLGVIAVVITVLLGIGFALMLMFAKKRFSSAMNKSHRLLGVSDEQITQRITQQQ